ncbi:MAG TPA: transglycosylase SLT domain-containing protein [Gammaproteobacteria bacterium]|nr:transglycosylase SLT domain-containing protein [Gammaproteobacteria bacterium]
MTVRTPARFAALLLALVGPSAFADDPYAGARQVFLLAYAAVEAGAPLPSAIDPEALRDYPLYPYLERARLTRALGRAQPGSSAIDDDVRAFLAEHAGEPVSNDLQRAWLASLATRQQWQTFLASFDPAVADSALRCDRARAKVVLDTEDATRTALELWLAPQRLPPECEVVFDWLRARGALTEELVEQRVRALLANGQASFARTIARDLPAERAAPLQQWADLLEKPEPTIDALLHDPKNRPVADAALLAGWTKLARNAPLAAQARYEQVSALVGPEHAGDYALALAFGLAWDRRAPEALAAFAKLPTERLDDNARAWQARAALWAGNWEQVEQSIQRMSAAQQTQARWQYWAARAAAARDDSARAETLYQTILPSDNYYAANAALRLGRQPEPHPQRLAVNDDVVAALAAHAGFVRSRELFLCGLKSAAAAEWASATLALDAGQRAQAVHLAARWQWHDMSVTTAAREHVFYDYALLYPQPYDEQVQAAAKLANLDATLIYGVIRQESLFRTDVVSSAGAVGLAQVMPATAREIARAWQRPVPATAELFDPAVNITLGAAHLRDLMNRYGQQTIVALAGYNAGERAVERWLPTEPVDADIWTENIPYNETREYVQRVLWHSVVFGWLTSGSQRERDAWLAQIAPLATRVDGQPAI